MLLLQEELVLFASKANASITCIGPLDSPPPPYTPNAQGRTGPRSPPLLQTTNLRNTSVFGHDVASPASAITVISPLSMRSRSEAPMNFPPPPPNANRSGSGSRSRFGLSALTRGRSSDRTNSANNTPAIEALQYNTREALANAPVQWSSPQMRPLTGYGSCPHYIFSAYLFSVGNQAMLAIDRRSTYLPVMSRYHLLPRHEDQRRLGPWLSSRLSSGHRVCLCHHLLQLLLRVDLALRACLVQVRIWKTLSLFLHPMPPI